MWSRGSSLPVLPANSMMMSARSEVQCSPVLLPSTRYADICTYTNHVHPPMHSPQTVIKTRDLGCLAAHSEPSQPTI
jgi:hypothetical protein